jgi:ankyrin repeat protein
MLKRKNLVRLSREDQSSFQIIPWIASSLLAISCSVVGCTSSQGPNAIDCEKAADLTTAAQGSCLGTAERLIKGGGDVNEVRKRANPFSVSEDWSKPDYIYASSNEEITPLIVAIEQESLPMVELLLKNGADIHKPGRRACDPNDSIPSYQYWGCGTLMSPLHFASKTGNAEIVKKLLESGAKSDVDNKTFNYVEGLRDGVASLHFSKPLDLNWKSAEVAKLLVEAGAEVSRGALSFAVDSGSLELAGYYFLTLRKDTEEQSPFTRQSPRRHMIDLATVNDNPEMIKLLAKAGAKLDRTPPYSKNYGNCYNPLDLAIEACNGGCLNSVSALLDVGADPNKTCAARDESVFEHWTADRTPLMRAALTGSRTLVEALVTRGADAQFKNRHGMSALHFAGSPAVMDYLISKGLDLNTRDALGNTALLDILHLEGDLSTNETIDLIRHALSQGAQADVLDNRGFGPVHIALEEAQLYENEPGEKDALELIKFLVGAGVKATTTSRTGVTPLHIAARRNSLDIVKYLVQNGANAQALAGQCDRSSCSIYSERESGAALHWHASLEGSPISCGSEDFSETLALQKYLLDLGVPVDAKDSYGEPALLRYARLGLTGRTVAPCRYTSMLPLLKQILEKGANPNVPFTHGEVGYTNAPIELKGKSLLKVIRNQRNEMADFDAIEALLLKHGAAE